MNTGVLTQCLKNPTGAPTIVKSRKKEILKSDLDALVSAATSHHSAKYVYSLCCKYHLLVPAVGPGSGSWCPGNPWSTNIAESYQSQNLQKFFMSIL